MNNSTIPPSMPMVAEEDRNRRKREGILIVVGVVVVAVLTFFENRIVHFGADFPIYNTILMFILININLLLLISLLYLVFRNLVKLLYDRKRKVMGSKLRTRLVVAFIALTLLPTGVLFFFSITFITKSIEFWFNVPVEQALENSLHVGREFYQQAEANHQFLIKKISYQIETRQLADPPKDDDLSNYVSVVQREFNLTAIEVYDANATRIAYALAPELADRPFRAISADNLHHGTATGDGVRSISEQASSGELYRTIGTVPFGVDGVKADAFVVLTVLVSPDLSNKLASISRGFEEYQQIKLLKEPIEITFYITLSIVALLVMFCAIWFGFYMAKSITTPIRELAEGARRVAEGDLGFSIDMVADDEIGSLVDAFNSMTDDLRIGREQLEESARLLQEQNIAIEERRQNTAIVLKNVSAGVVTFDADGCITTINTSAEKMLAIRPEEILGKPYTSLLTGEHLRLADGIMETLSISKDGAVETNVRLTIAGTPRSYMMHVNALTDDRGNHLGIVVVFDDLTELEQAQRMAAWREVARRIAHEVKNPLTPIKLSAQRLKRKYSLQVREDVFDECTDMIIDHVDRLGNIVSEFASFASFPTAHPIRCDLVPIIEETLALYRDGHQEIDFRIHVSEYIPQLNLDRQQIKQVLINLLDNAIRAIGVQGGIDITITHDAILRMVLFEVADDGTGIADEDKTRLFEPQFSTKKSGMGLGLTIVNSIIADHMGRIRVQDNRPVGAKFVIELPVI
ncbi:MAG: ATP-binding protein [Desulfobacterales bacterium]